MAKAVTQKFSELALEVEFDPVGAPGVYSRVCGMIDVEINRSASLDSAEIPDCDDESLPHSVEKEVRSIEVSVSGSGTWAQQSHGKMSDWFYSAAPLNVRVHNANAAVGETEYETGPALLASLGNARTKGQRVSASISIEFDGTPTRTPKAA